MENVNCATMPHQTLKELGNRLFNASRFKEAANYYTQAITKQPNISTYYSNRAICYLQVQEYSKTLADCRKSIELDDSNVKAYFFAAQAHMGLHQWDEAIPKLIQARTLALEQRRNFGDDIASTIRLAKRKRFEEAEKQRKKQEIALQTYLNNLILQEANRQKQALIIAHRSKEERCEKEALETALPSMSGSSTQGSACSSVQIHAVSDQNTSESDTMPPTVTAKCSEITMEAQKRISELNDLFVQLDERRQNREVPEYLCGRISFELMLDPVITPNGVTYDRQSILDHLRKVGHFDPLTHQPLTESHLIPNLSMKEVVHAFLEENPWAEGY